MLRWSNISQTWDKLCLCVFQEVEEVDMARFIQQLESHISTEVHVVSKCVKCPPGWSFLTHLQSYTGLLHKHKLWPVQSKQFFNFQPVSVLEDITDQKTAENQSAIFKCRIQINYPEISLTWYKGTQKLDNSHKYEISSVGDLHCLKVKDCDTRDEGNYRVVCGPHISNAKLSVAGKVSCCVCLLTADFCCVLSYWWDLRQNLLESPAGSRQPVATTV